MSREAERVEPRANERREMAAGFLSSSMEEEGEVGKMGERGGEESVGEWLPLALACRLASGGFPFEWSVWGSQGLRCVGFRSRGEGGVAIEGGVMPEPRLRL